ncbi:Glucan endo-1,3-alpha-glucosidase agn1 [Elsinoe australis]|uniref:Glucan endo-1,3-alpha-glucosidase agn1 n=1 Tax=Elsinoe australis TaxID=40998 RepID=A0A2P7YDM6_9PEZI|nr:Glucan endo-1,3-alpha-glucosidase agn1 [Elsinoe australis]
MLPTTLTLLLTTSLTTALVLPRAGGPAYNPIPTTCSVPNPLPPTAPGVPATNFSTNGLAPSPSFRAAHLIYQFYLPSPDSTDIAERWEGCLEQCNGLSGCVAAFMADGMRTPKGWYGTEGGVESRGCLMFNGTLAEGDFVTREKVRGATAGNIACPE